MRVTCTIIVFSIFALVTTPVTSWRSWRAGAGAAAVSLTIRFPQFALTQQSLDAGQILPRRSQLGDGLGLSGGELKAQPEDLLGQFILPLVQFRRILIAHFFNSLGHQSAPARLTKRVRIGSLCAASCIASCAVARSTPAISNITRPGFTTATHFSGAPFPLPMRVSAGFLVNGLSRKIRIQSFPPRLMNRVMATRDASICRSVIHAGSSALSPYSPKESSPPRQALPLRRPRCCFRYFTFFGINIVVVPYTLPSNNPQRLKRPRARPLFSVRALERFRLDTPSTSRQSRRKKCEPRQNQNRCPRAASAAAAALASTIPCARFPRRSNGRRRGP